MSIAISCPAKQISCSRVIVLQSFDNVKFIVDKEELEIDTSGFPPATTPSYIGEVSSLPERSHVLNILFQYVGTQSHRPVLDQIEFALIIKVAEAAEKYEVHKAITAVQFELRKFLKSNSRELLYFALTYWNPQLVEEVAPFMINTPLQEIETLMKHCPRLFMKWASRKNDEDRWRVLFSYGTFVPDIVPVDPLNGLHLSMPRKFLEFLQ
ncbi:uncharacterized protein C8R40DRAFT_1075021 [Lentinula edodes]|uniref:uncharacterized protein n=1 Tax=Lentinula edodes TaxID=5353 RepID=UPI001E8E27C9|nr:uncharacterized protein C8R40DRAFT_1075021 [Lentinula edodes]KAH7868162.1 hypothetical protein C8R40DRAFT_1075021 [Lentinula edodes]